MLQETLQSVGLQKPTLENSIWYNGHTFSFLLDASKTADTFALIHCHFRRGGEPPAHFHLKEDEIFYILEGEIHFHIGDKTFTAKAGDLAHASKGIPHQFSLVTETAKALLVITPPGLEIFFKEFGVAAQSLELPALPEGQPPAAFLESMFKRATQLGIVWMPEF
jgi:quercetin dioxygenase-like cupin family protein